MVKLASLAIDKTASREGVWIPFEGGELKVARIGTPEWEAAFNPELERLEEQVEARKESGDDLTKAEIEDLRIGAVRRSLAAACLKDIRGFEDDNGNPIEITAEVKHALCCSDEYEGFYERILMCANGSAQYRLHRNETLAKN
jgi:hypothetical protein